MWVIGVVEFLWGKLNNSLYAVVWNLFGCDGLQVELVEISYHFPSLLGRRK
jgi:hypothetical protein